MLAQTSQQTLTQSEQIAWYDVIGRFRAKAQEFERAFQDLLAQSSFVQQQAPEVRAEYDQLVRKGAETYQRVYKIKQALVDVENALRGAWQYVTGAWQKIAGYIGLGEVSGLGFVPLIPIAAVTAAIATLGYFISDYAKFMKKIGELRRLESQGMTPQQAAETVAKLEGSGFLGKIPWIVIIAGALLIAIPFLRGSDHGR